MDIFKSVGEMLTKLVRGNKAEPISKMDILSLIDNNILALKIVVDTYDSNQDLFKYIKRDLVPMNGSNKENSHLRELHASYLKGLSIPLRHVEEGMILKTLRDAAQFALMDHEKIRDEFSTLFNDGTDVADVQLDQMKLTHATIFGFINLSALLSDWFCFFYTGISGREGENPKVPPYREQMIANSAKTVADFVNDVTARSSRRSIIDVIQGIRKTGDVALYTGAATLDTYANINDYPGVARFISSFNILQPILWVREALTTFSHNQYKRNTRLREWMITKTAILRMDLDKVDPNSKEYQHQLTVLSKYGAEIAKLDKKIAAYEQI